MKERWLLNKLRKVISGEKLSIYRSKKAMNFIARNIVFIVLTAAVFGLLFMFVARAGSNVGFYEQAYAKQIALLIDSAKPGTNITMDVSKLVSLAKKNGLKEKLIDIKPNTKEITVRVRDGKGYTYKHFNGATVMNPRLCNKDRSPFEKGKYFCFEIKNR